MNAVPSRIGLLPEHLIDQIKAGEVIERPGNLIKEILENAIDAGSTRLELIVKNNGLDLISLKDNGQGIFASDLPLAFSRHATSKISRFEDLYRLHSFGFRGEALASMAAISKLQCVSFSKWEDEGAEIRIEGGRTTFTGSRAKNGHLSGTEIVIQELFYNTPVRLKFIQSQQAEKNFIKKIVYSFILAHPKIEFVIKFDEDDKEVHLPRENLSDRLKDLVPKALNSIIFTAKDYEDNRIDLHLIPGSFRVPVNMQYIYVNQRFVLDKQLHRVLSNALMSSFGSDDFHYVASLTLPPDNIDVNVHPNKTIIKLFEASKLIGLMTGTIKELAATAHNPKPKEAESSVKFDFIDEAKNPSLSQERHAYNMEGHFSPHLLHRETPGHIFWLGKYFIKQQSDKWEAFHAPRLLKVYVDYMLKEVFSTIPLLVSEPFKIKGQELKMASELLARGIELEKLGADTLVLRSIPDWMNGFPLRSVIGSLLNQKSLEYLEIQSQDWSQSTWEEMISAFEVNFLREHKIALDLEQLLEDKLK